MIILGVSPTKGVGSGHALLMGSVSYAVAHRAECPVVLVPEDAKRTANGRVVVGIDGSKGALDAANWALHFAEDMHRNLELITAWHYPYSAMSPEFGVMSGPDIDELRLAMLRDARERYSVPVIEVIQPAVRRAVAASRTGRIGVIGTRATIDSKAYLDAFAAAPQLQVTSIACPVFVEFVERGETSGEAITKVAREYLKPVMEADVDTLVLGCTHYPLLTGVISYVMGNSVSLVSSAEETAKDLYRTLVENSLLRAPSSTPASHKFLATGDSAAFEVLARRFLGPEVGSVQHISKLN